MSDVRGEEHYKLLKVFDAENEEELPGGLQLKLKLDRLHRAAQLRIGVSCSSENRFACLKPDPGACQPQMCSEARQIRKFDIAACHADVFNAAPRV